MITVLIVYLRDLALRAVCNYMVWMKCGAALVRWLIRKCCLQPWLRIHRNATQSVKSINSLSYVLSLRFRGWPATNSFQGIDVLEKTNNKLESKGQRTRARLTNKHKKKEQHTNTITKNFKQRARWIIKKKHGLNLTIVKNKNSEQHQGQRMDLSTKEIIKKQRTIAFIRIK